MKLLSAIVLLIGLAIPSPAQSTPPPATAATAPSFGFDVVSVRLNKAGAAAMAMASPSESDGVTFGNVPLFRIVLYTYRINRFNQLLGLPPWSMTERYDISAKVAPVDVAEFQRLSRAQRMKMFEAVLADRFKLRIHRETRDSPVYSVVVAKGGLKMKEATPGETYPNGPKSGTDTIAHGQTIFVTGPGQLTGQGASVEDLTVTLSDYARNFIGREVVDKSGLAGRYDFKLQFAPNQVGADSDAADSQQTETPASGTSIFTALEEQLGLKLQPATAREEFFVIDHIERPSEN